MKTGKRDIKSALFFGVFLILIMLPFFHRLSGLADYADSARLILRDRILTALEENYANYLRGGNPSNVFTADTKDKPITQLLTQSGNTQKLDQEITEYLKQNLPTLPVIGQLRCYMNARRSYFWYAIFSAGIFIIIILLQQYPLSLKRVGVIFLPFIIFWLFLAGHLLHLYPHSDKSYYQYISFRLKQFSPPSPKIRPEGQTSSIKEPIWSIVRVNPYFDTRSYSGYTFALFENGSFHFIRNNQKNR